jgi:hypothetical protein
MSANPRIVYVVSWFKAWAVGLSGLSVSLYPVIFFGYTIVMEDCCVSPKEVLKVKRADGNMATFVKAKDKVSAWGLWVLVLFPTVVLEVS